MTTAKQARTITSGLASIHSAPSPTHGVILGAGTSGLTTISLNALNNIKTSHGTNVNSGYYQSSPNITSALNTVSLSALNISGLMTQDVHHKVKKYEIYESPEDILVLSAASKRLRDKNVNIFHKLLEKELFDRITPEDRETAQAIRDYYSKKIMIWKLKDSSRMSSYREDLNTFVHSDGLTFKEEMIGLAYHLPSFYEYDLDLDYVRSCVDINQEFKKLDDDNRPRILKCTVKLEPIKKIVKKRKRLEAVQYWFKDTELNAGCVIQIDKNNPLEHIWEHLFNTEKVLQIEGNFIRLKLDDFEYFRVKNWNLSQT